jgi:death-on-curing protein
MATQRDYLTVVDALDLHRQLIDLFGGSHGVRDMGALESALFRPQSGYYDDIVQEACALLESLAINHPFVDGNKRIAFAVMDSFLRINGYRVHAKPMAIYRKLIDLFDRGEFELKYLDAYFRDLIKPIV